MGANRMCIRISFDCKSAFVTKNSARVRVREIPAKQILIQYIFDFILLQIEYVFNFLSITNWMHIWYLQLHINWMHTWFSSNCKLNVIQFFDCESNIIDTANYIAHFVTLTHFKKFYVVEYCLSFQMVPILFLLG